MTVFTLEEFNAHLALEPVKKIQFLRLVPISDILIDYANGRREHHKIDFFSKIENYDRMSNIEADEAFIMRYCLTDNAIGIYISPEDFNTFQGKVNAVCLDKNILLQRSQCFPQHIFGEGSSNIVEKSDTQVKRYQHGCESRFFSHHQINHIRSIDPVDPQSYEDSASSLACTQQ